MLGYNLGGLHIVTKEGGTVWGERPMPFVYHADFLVVVRALWHRHPPEVGRCSSRNWRPLQLPNCQGTKSREQKDQHRQRQRTSRSDQLGLRTRDASESQNETCLFIDSSLSLS